MRLHDVEEREECDVLEAPVSFVDGHGDERIAKNAWELTLSARL